jgi:predicted nucleic acid-binding Zn ribbon protein
MKKVANLMPKAIEAEVMRLSKAHGVLKHWDEIVGPALAERSWPDRYDRKIVWVAVQGSAWAQELRLMKEVILARLRSRSNDPDLFGDVRFGVRKLPPREPEATPEVDEPERRESLSIREIAERRLKGWPGAPGD